MSAHHRLYENVSSFRLMTWSVVAELVDAAEVSVSVGGQLAVTRVIKGLDGDDSLCQIVMAPFEVRSEGDFGRAWNGDEHLSHVGDRNGNLTEEGHLVGRSS